MKNEMIERVAKALFDNIQSKMPAFKPIAWDDYTEKEHFKSSAKAAIMAMREPTDEMKSAGSIDPGAGGPDNGYETEVWQSMIDAALKE